MTLVPECENGPQNFLLYQEDQKASVGKQICPFGMNYTMHHIYMFVFFVVVYSLKTSFHFTNCSLMTMYIRQEGMHTKQ